MSDPASHPEEDELLSFSPEDEAPPDDGRPEPAPWKILVADDDDEVRAVTRTILRELRFDGRGVALLEAASGAETLARLTEHPDTAVVLLDVVMESDNAGLDAVRAIRGELGNRFVRIILRTGQPGHAPERQVIVDYDINDYKEKTELTVQKLVTAIIAGLRSHRDLMTIERSRLGLEKIIAATRDLFEPQSVARLSRGVLGQLSMLLDPSDGGLATCRDGLAAMPDPEVPDAPLCVVAGSGRFEAAVGDALGDVLPGPWIDRLLAVPPHLGRIEDDAYVGHFPTSGGADHYLYVETPPDRHGVDGRLLELFTGNVGIAIDNAYLQEELAATQHELSCTLSQLVESRSHETGRHVLRVGALACHLAGLVARDESECQILRLSAPMHDIGKVAIPDAILNKPGALTTPELAVMREHARIGHDILARSRRPALRSAATIALQHHERWDGSGYPLGLRGEGIDLHGRIVGLVDVFDALSHPRCYKRPWPLERIYDYLRQGAGKQFDPELTTVFLHHVEEFEAIWTRYRDPFRDDPSVDPDEL